MNGGLRLLAAALGIVAAAPAFAQIKLPPPSPPLTQEVVDLVVPPNSQRVRYLLVKPANATPLAGIVLFAGGDGLLKIAIDGTIQSNLAQNFLVRSRAMFAAKGLAVAVVDNPGGVPIDGIVRTSAPYATEMGAVIADLRQRAGVTGVWAIGTSTGAMSAANVAARLPRVVEGPFSLLNNNNRPAGLVLTSPQSFADSAAGCNKTVFNTTLSAVNVPSLVVTNSNDHCSCSPPGNAASILAALSQVTRKASQSFTSSTSAASNGVCDSLTPHGYFGIEQRVVDSIAAWMFPAR